MASRAGRGEGLTSLRSGSIEGGSLVGRPQYCLTDTDSSQSAAFVAAFIHFTYAGPCSCPLACPHRTAIRGQHVSLQVASGDAPSPTVDVRDLVARAATGEDAAWSVLFDTHYSKLYRFFRSRVATHQRAEDLASDVFLEAFRSIGNFQWQGAPFEAWLYGIARRVLASYYRARHPIEMQPTEHVRDEYVAVEIRDILDRIHPDYRMALELRFIVGLSGAEAAAAMGRGHGAFRSLLLRAVRAFRTESAHGSDASALHAIIEPEADGSRGQR